MPLITDMAKREAVLQRVAASLAQKRAAAAKSRQRAEAAYEATRGHPIDDYWQPMKPLLTWWKLWAYYIERGFLVGIVVTQDGQKVAKSLLTIEASFLIIGGTALALMVFQPYLKVHTCLKLHIHTHDNEIDALTKPQHLPNFTHSGRRMSSRASLTWPPPSTSPSPSPCTRTGSTARPTPGSPRSSSCRTSSSSAWLSGSWTRVPSCGPFAPSTPSSRRGRGSTSGGSG